jgi:hypothetical protein
MDAPCVWEFAGEGDVAREILMSYVHRGVEAVDLFE